MSTLDPSAPTPSSSRKPSRVASVRAGKGGRRRKRATGSEQQALDSLIERLGEPRSDRRVNGCRLLVWRMRSGDGAIVGRMSGREVQNGETAESQLMASLELMAREGRRPRLVIMVLEASGFRPYADRADLQFIEELIKDESDWLRWVCWRGVDRITRDYLPGHQHLDLLKRHSVDLYLQKLGRKVDWVTDDVVIQAMMMASKIEAENIRQRTHDALLRNHLQRGKGWPNGARYGCYRLEDETDRDRDGFFVEDPEQMLRVHWLYRQAVQGKSFQELSELFAQTFSPETLSRSAIRQILTDPLYTCGQWWTSYEGELYQGRPIQFSPPVPRELWQRVQDVCELRRGKFSSSLPGAFALNGLLRHAACMDLKHVKKDGTVTEYRLRGSNRDSRQPMHYHSPNVPDCCRGYGGLSRHALEATVCSALRELIDHPELEEAWARRHGLDEGAEVALVDEEQLQALEAERERLRTHMLGAGEEAAARLGQEGVDYSSVLLSLNALQEGLEKRLQTLDRRITEARRAHATPLRPRSHADDRNLESLRDRMRRLLTDEPPEEDDLREQRAVLIRSLLSAVIVHDQPDGTVELELRGWLVPESAANHTLPNSLEVASEALSALDALQAGQQPAERQGQVIKRRGPEARDTHQREIDRAAEQPPEPTLSAEQLFKWIKDSQGDEEPGDEGEAADTRAHASADLLRPAPRGDARGDVAGDHRQAVMGEGAQARARAPRDHGASGDDAASGDDGEEGGAAVPTKPYGLPSNSVGTPAPPHSSLAPAPVVKSDRVGVLERADHVILRPYGVLERALVPAETAGPDGLVRLDPGPRKGPATRIAMSNARLAKSRQPAYASHRVPLVDVPEPPPAHCTIELVRSTMREVVEHMPAVFEPLSKERYAELAELVGAPAHHQLAHAARSAGTDFSEIVWTAFHQREDQVARAWRDDLTLEDVRRALLRIAEDVGPEPSGLQMRHLKEHRHYWEPSWRRCDDLAREAGVPLRSLIDEAMREAHGEQWLQLGSDGWSTVACQRALLVVSREALALEKGGLRGRRTGVPLSSLEYAHLRDGRPELPEHRRVWTRAMREGSSGAKWAAEAWMEALEERQPR